eukprot:CAMPEP_0178899550 /NCGR_PEP_ID=MMETSP0786-20121207/2965_1 /TAXON_ID=186022 /ORGANISM="Thalassionema frauenfeldii, Strain CCMP 1798" /LENGTH=250 /DNA_ID=CAMNT_0020570425 /DNA_START=13 /DNA_END=765 /DNA_ORIENTATION=-
MSLINVKSILDKNNEGVDHICNGRFNDAKKAFKTTLLYLTIFHERLREDEQQQQRDQCPEEEKNCDPADFPIIIETRPIPESPDPTSPSHSLYMYRNVLMAHMDPTAKLQVTMTEENSACVTALVMFNLSITFHYKSDLNDYDSVANQLKVLRFYKKAWEALRIDASVTSEHHSYRDTVVLGILNNMGALFHELSKYKKAWYCFKSLKNVLSSESPSVKAVPPEIQDGMLMNVLFFEERYERLEALGWNH